MDSFDPTQAFDFSPLLNEAFSKLRLDLTLEPHERFSEEELNLIKEKKALDPISILPSVRPEEIPAFKEEIYHNLSLYLKMLTLLLADRENVEKLASHQGDLNESIQKARNSFTKRWGRELRVYSSVSVTQASLLHRALMAVAKLEGMMTATQVAYQALHANVVNEINKVIVELNKKHWLTDWGMMHLIYRLNQGVSRKELDEILEKHGISLSNRKKFLARIPETKAPRDEWFIYREDDGSFSYGKPGTKPAERIVQKGIDGVENAFKRVCELNLKSQK